MSATPVINERAWAVDLISEINRMSDGRKRCIQNAGGEWGVAPGAAGNVIFPDVLLFGDPARNAVLQGWELKMPETPVTDSALLDNAQEKSRRLGLSSFLVWNAVDAVLYRVTDGKRSVVKSWRCEGIRTRDDVKRCKSAWVDTLGEIIDDLNDYFEQGSIPCSRPLPEQLNDVIAAILSEWEGILAESLKAAERRSRTWRSEVSVWWRSAKAEHGNPDDRMKHGILAAEILLHWIHRFLFAHYLRRFVTDASLVDRLNGDSSIKDAEALFNTLSRKHDFAQIFKPRQGAERLPAPVWNAILAFNGFLGDARFPDIEQGLLQETLQSVRQESQRKVAGQYCTPPMVADLLVKLAADDLTTPVLDPCCGTGTIARAVMALKIKHGMQAVDAIKTTWASDRYAMPLQFATLSLTSGEAPFETLRVFQHDVLTLQPGEPVTFVDAGTGNAFTEKLPSFPCIVVNPPFIRSEDWMRKDASVVDVFNFIKEQTGESIGSRADYFVPILHHVWRLTSEGGRIGAIFPNAWLGADWGLSFRRILQKFFKIEFVITSGSGRWFRNADIVVNVVILKKRETNDVRDTDEELSFAVTQLPLSAWTDEHTAAVADAMIRNDAQDSGIVRINRLRVSDLDNYDAAGLCWTACFMDCRWIKDIEESLVPASSLFEIHRGERRGWDDLFYPPADSGIEPEYLLPVLKSAAVVKRLDAHADGLAFCCSRSVEELERRGDPGALAWIRKFENAKNGKGEPLTRTLAKGGYLWYEMRPDTTADLAVSVNPDKRFFFARLNPRAFVNQRLIRFTAKAATDLPLCHALLCSLAGCFYLEALGFGRGLGVLDLNAGKLSRQMKMLDPALISEKGRGRILSMFDRLMKRDVMALEDELNRPDRQDFERAVFDSFGLASRLPDIREAVLGLRRIRAAACDAV